ncbi:diguanylate cyclase [Aquihabitans sp. G128]|uniref:sensor domain-containing protein n=1 Tax=Aquihabitans sp. G128 TaxID=2849779 RepID=UPI001C22CF9C|nr:diguanylate cyclase [Aquihabitans sp. G128]QXC61998.1 diguanylate cyclase [Aquihabitans sp. G128]
MTGEEHAPAARPLDAAAVLGAVPGVIVLIERDGTVRWVNEHVTSFSGHRPEELIGTNMLDHLGASANPQALESIGYALDHAGVQLPTVLGFRAVDGSTIILEAIANNQFDEPSIAALVVHLGPYDERAALDRVLGSLAAGDDPEVSFGHLHQVARGATLRAESAVVFGDGRAIASSPEAAAPIGARCHDPSATPWAVAATTGRAVVLPDVSSLAPAARAAARKAGFEACWAHPIGHVDDDGVGAVLVIWRREPGWPEPNATTLADQLVRLGKLALDRDEHRHQLLHAARHDHLTGLANRARFYDVLAEHLAARHAPVGVLYVDLDRFKEVNDAFGHGHGDRVLQEVAVRLDAGVGPTATVARLGGDEFGICQPGSDTSMLTATAERLLAALEAPIPVGDQEHRIGATIGIALSAATRPTSTDHLVGRADAALVEGKASTKGTWHLAEVEGGAAPPPR